MKTSFKTLIKANYQQILLVFLAFLAMVLVSYYYVSSIVRSQMQALGEEVMNTTQTAVTGSLSETELIFTNTVQALENLILAGADNAEVLTYLQESNRYFGDARSPLPDFLKVYGYIRGEFLDGSGWTPPPDYDPPARPWYIGAKDNGGTMYFSEPYIDADTGGMCISFSRELFDASGTSQGIVAIDLNLSRVTTYVANQQIANGGYGILLSDTLHITTHRDATLVERAMGSVNPEYARIGRLLLAGKAVSAERFTDYDGVDSVVFFRQIFNGWYIGIVTPRANYYAQVYQMGVVLGVLGAALMVILSSLLVRSRAEKMRADEESRSKSNFLARMSHEMRTPMNAIIGMTDIALRTDDPEKVHYSLERIHDAADHLLGVINDVLDMSKIEAGKLDLAAAPFAFRPMIEKTASVMGYKFEEKHQHFTINVAPEVPDTVVTDEQRLAQVITNLLSNATKFTPDEGHIALTVAMQETDGENCTLLIEVTDDGIGLSQEQQARLFRSFEQADNTISRKYGGTGLGLAISKRLIQMMGGDAWIESELGEGARFSFTIRAGIGPSLPTAESAAAPTESNTGIFTGRHILLAEDIEINQEILIALLEETGVQIDCAGNGREAYEQFTAHPQRYSLIFMDIHMPEVDGYEAARLIRNSGAPNAQEIPIVAMTADVFREDVERATAAGMNGHVGKPINMDEVIGVMRTFLL